jgi:retron-type reverse transcriptase
VLTGLIEQFEKHKEAHFRALKNFLLSGTYSPHPVLRKYIVKDPKKGTRRPLGIPSVLDRVAQESVRRIIEPILDREFLDSSYGFREGRSTHDAAAKVEEYVKRGYKWIPDANIKSFFSEVDRDIAVSLFRRIISDSRVITLVERWLTVEVVEEGRLIEKSEVQYKRA